MKRGDDYNYIKDGIGHHMWEQCLTLYPQLKDKVNDYHIQSRWFTILCSLKFPATLKPGGSA